MDGPGEDLPFPLSTEEMRANNDYFFGHMMVAEKRYAPDAAAPWRGETSSIWLGAPLADMMSVSRVAEVDCTYVQ